MRENSIKQQATIKPTASSLGKKKTIKKWKIHQGKLKKKHNNIRNYKEDTTTYIKQYTWFKYSNILKVINGMCKKY